MRTEYLTEPFLTYYYLLESVCKGFITETQRKYMFDSIARIFCIDSEAELDELYRQSDLPWICNIDDYASYERACRTLQFGGLSGQNAEMGDLDRLMLAAKRRAMIAKDVIFNQVRALTPETVATVLRRNAEKGHIYAMEILSYMEYEGICRFRLTETTAKRMRLCAGWNSVFANLMGIVYDKENADTYFTTLYSVLYSDEKSDAFEHICKYSKYSHGGSVNRSAEMLKKAFKRGTVKSEVYDRAFAKVLFSQLISDDGKERLIFSKQKEWETDFASIPFGAKRGDKRRFSTDCTDTLPIKRDEECMRIVQNMVLAFACPDRVYRPLLIAANDEFVCSMYANMIMDGLGGAGFIQLDATQLTEYDFAPVKDNIFLRSIAETNAADTVFIIKNCEELEGRLLGELVKFFDYGYRSKYRLGQSTLTLDLSGMKFVLLADAGSTAVKMLGDFCDVVAVGQLREEEKNKAIDAVFAHRVAAFGLEDAKLEEDCYGFLTKHGIAQMNAIVDGALRRMIFTGRDIITLDDLKDSLAEQNVCANNREFGFMGGRKNA